jgi:hypothetical protein
MVNGVDGIRNNLRRDDEVWRRCLMYIMMTWDISNVVDDHSVLVAQVLHQLSAVKLRPHLVNESVGRCL